eukprot:s303_g20.t2
MVMKLASESLITWKRLLKASFSQQWEEQVAFTYNKLFAMDVEDEAWGSTSESRGEDGFSMRGGAFSLLGHVSEGPPEEEVKELSEEDAALAAFDQLWEQQPDPNGSSGPEELGDPEDQLQSEETNQLDEIELLEPETSVSGKGKGDAGKGGGGWDEPSPGPLPPEDEEEDVEVEVEVECEDEEEEVEELIEEIEEVEEVEEEPPMPPAVASASGGKAKGKAKVAPPSDEEPEPEETDDDDEEEIGISKGKAWLKGKGKGDSQASQGKGKEKGKGWGMDWSGKGWKGDDFWWGKGDWAKGDWRRDWNWSKGDWGSGGSEWGKGWQDWSPSRNRDRDRDHDRDRDRRDDRDDGDDRDDRRRPGDRRPEPEGPPTQRRRTSSAERTRAPEPSSKEEWIRAQYRLFGHLKPLPENWIRIKSKSSGNIYFYNTKTGESTFDEPSPGLPDPATSQDTSSQDISGTQLRSELVSSEVFAQLRADARLLLAARRQSEGLSESQLQTEVRDFLKRSWFIITTEGANGTAVARRGWAAATAAEPTETSRALMSCSKIAKRVA